jgi:PIN domain nuclease of toxin-antitoxin system
MHVGTSSFNATGSCCRISLLEIALKAGKGKLVLHSPFPKLFPAQLGANQIRLLPLEVSHIERLMSLPFHHRDPHDRVLAATALDEGLPLLSADSTFDAYGVSRIWR